MKKLLILIVLLGGFTAFSQVSFDIIFYKEINTVQNIESRFSTPFTWSFRKDLKEVWLIHPNMLLKYDVISYTVEGDLISFAMVDKYSALKLGVAVNLDTHMISVYQNDYKTWKYFYSIKRNNIY